MRILRAGARDHDAIWSLIGPVIRAGCTYALPRAMRRETALTYWLGPDKTTFIARLPDDTAVGTYYLRVNQPGGGGHVCNCGYVTSEAARGQGVGARMGRHSIDEARAQGFRAMQFNGVVASNVGAVGLWRKLGFAIVGTVPDAFHHPDLGYVDTHIMYRSLVQDDG